MWGPIASLLWAGAVVVLPTGTTCPSGDAIAAELDRLGVVAALAALGSPEVTVKDTKMHVVLRGLDGSTLGARDITAPEACQERATVAAVFIAAWVGEWTTTPMAEAQDVKPENPNHNAVPSVPRPRPRTTEPASRATLPSRERREVAKADDAAPSDAKAAPPATRAAAALPVVSADAAAAPSATKAAATPPVATAETKAPAVAAKKPKRGLQGEVAGLGFGTHDGDAGTFGAGILVGYRPSGALALAALFEVMGERERKLGPGFAAYRTYRLGVGAGVLRKRGRFFGDVGLFPELTLLTLSGKQLAPGRSATAWGAAADLRARLGLAVGRVAPFLFGGASYAFLGERLTLDDSTQNITLSRWNVSAGAGLAFLFGAR
jgi:hypothetical protein